MVVHLQKLGGQYTAIIPPQMVEEFGLTEGSALEVSPATDGPLARSIRYMSVEEALQAFENSLPRHEAAYRELAK